MNIRLFVCFLLAFSVGTVYSYPPNVYEFICEAGTAGTAVCARLSKYGRVLILERGKDVSNDPSVAVATKNLVLPTVDLTLLPVQHQHSYEPNLAVGHTPTFEPFAVSGGPAVSGSFAGRGDPSDYDEWADLTGDISLRYEHLIEYFKKSENVDINDSDSEDRGRDGPLDITFLESLSDPTTYSMMQSMASFFGVSVGKDYATSNGTLGVWPMQRTLKREPTCTQYTSCTRSTSYTGYIEPELENGNPNITLITNANVISLAWKPCGNCKKIWGVYYTLGNEIVFAKAKKEVILSAGTFNSPKIMMLSGIGDKDELKQVGIDAIHHLPGVGKNLQDHTQVLLGYYFPNIVYYAPSPVIISFLSSNGTRPDIEVASGFLPAYYLIPGAQGSVYMTFIVQLRNTGDNGYVKLRSTNPFEKLDISFGFSADKMSPMNWAIRNVNEWVTSLGGSQFQPNPNSFNVSSASIESIQGWISANVAGWYHMAGTCKMGSSNDTMAVVDTDFKVIGIEGLRVVDNSVQPKLVSSHPSMTALMLAERAAEIIIQQNY